MPNEDAHPSVRTLCGCCLRRVAEIELSPEIKADPAINKAALLQEMIRRIAEKCTEK